MSELKSIATVKPIRIAIIGTACRKEDAAKMTSQIFDAMMLAITSYIPQDRPVHLISGGAAGADHVAVATWLANPGKYQLTLFMPCLWDEKNVCAVTSACGYEMNKLHKFFSSVTNRDSLLEIETARKLGAKLDCSAAGFLARNSLVAKCDLLIAFTWGTSSKILRWNKCHSRRVHIPLASLVSSLSSRLPVKYLRSYTKPKVQDREKDSM